MEGTKNAYWEMFWWAEKKLSQYPPAAEMRENECQERSKHAIQASLKILHSNTVNVMINRGVTVEWFYLCGFCYEEKKILYYVQGKEAVAVYWVTAITIHWIDFLKCLHAACSLFSLTSCSSLFNTEKSNPFLLNVWK